jgi:hypothetical protein
MWPMKPTNYQALGGSLSQWLASHRISMPEADWQTPHTTASN